MRQGNQDQGSVTVAAHNFRVQRQSDGSYEVTSAGLPVKKAGTPAATTQPAARERIRPAEFDRLLG